MRHTVSALASIVLAAGILSPGTATSQTFATTLVGNNEVPAGSPDGIGAASITISGTTISYAIYVKGIGTPTGAHIHQAVAGEPGPVVVPFTTLFSGGTNVGTLTAPQDVVDGILANPANYYINVHTADYPGGALRGQLDVGASTAVTLGATLKGTGEAPNAGKTGAGGVATITVSGTTISYTILVDGIATATGAHIHRGVEGMSGPVVIPFNNTVNGGLISGVATTTPALASELLANPSGFYVNVHTADFPGGAVRGQLDQGPAPSVYFPTVVKASGVNGTNFVSDLRVLNPTLLTANVRAEYFAASDAGLSGPSATFDFPVGPGAQAVVNDLLGTLFGVSGSGALRITSDHPVTLRSRVLNDLRAAGGGTTGLLVPGLTLQGARIVGYLPLLSQASAADVAAGAGFRTNVGYFNPGSAPVDVTFKALKNDGTTIATSTVTVPGLAKVQKSVSDLFLPADPGLLVQQDFYISYTASASLFVYATVADDKTGDGLYEDGAAAR